MQSGSSDDGGRAEINRRVGRAGFALGQRVFGRQLRLPSSLLEDDFIDPNMIAQDATHEMRRSEAMRMAAAHECVVAADRRAMSTASHSGYWWLENPSSYTDGRMEPKDGVDLAYASRVKNRSLDETRQSGCTGETACISPIAHR